MRLDKIAWTKLYTGLSVPDLNIIYLLSNDTDSNSEYIPGVATTRLAQVAHKKIIQVIYMHTRLTVNGVLQGFLKGRIPITN
jgi:hypothetical protein